MRNIKKQNVKRNPRVTRVSTPKPRSAQSKHHAAYRKAHPSPGRPKPIRRQGAGRRPIALGVQVAHAEVSPKVPTKVNPKVTRTHQVRHTTRNVQDANALGRFTADVGHGARTTVESYNFINPQTRSLRESTLFEVGVGTLTGQYTPEQGWGEAGRRVTEQPGRVVGEAAVEVGTALIPVGALFKAAKIGSAVRKANFLVKGAARDLPDKIPYKYGGTKMPKELENYPLDYTGTDHKWISWDVMETQRRMTYDKINPLKVFSNGSVDAGLRKYAVKGAIKKVKRKFTNPPPGGKGGSPRNYGDKLLKNTLVPITDFAAGWGGKGGSPRNYGDKLLKNTLVPVLNPMNAKQRYLNYISTRRAAGWETPVATRAFREVIDYGATKTTYTDNTASAIRSAKGDLAKTPEAYKNVDTFSGSLGWDPSGGKKFGVLVSPKKAKVPITRKKILPGLYKETEITPVGAFTEKTKLIKTAPGSKIGNFYTKPGKTYEVEDWRAGGPRYAPVEYKDAVYFSAPVKVKGLTKKLKKAQERGAVIKTEEAIVPYGKWYTIASADDKSRIILNTKWKAENVPVSVTETRYTGPVASLGRTAPITGTIGASVGVLGYGEFSDSSVGQGGIRTKIKKAVGAI